MTRQKFILPLKPLRPAKVSEISETTSSSSVPTTEQIHLHIGNPVSDSRLNQLYFDLLMGSNSEDLKAEYKSFIQHVIPLCSPYMARGGYNPKFPAEWVNVLQNWLSKTQTEPLFYDFGYESGRKECIMINGGPIECIRTILYSLQRYVDHPQVHVYFYGVDISLFEKSDTLFVHTIPKSESLALEFIDNQFNLSGESIRFLVVGQLMSESLRRHLRRLGNQENLFLIEMNDAPNHLSLAREAGMRDHVIRILSPAAIDQRLKYLSMLFILGNSELLRVFEAVQFELKGTPSASEAALFCFATEHFRGEDEPLDDVNQLPEDATETFLPHQQYSRLVNYLQSVSGRIENYNEWTQKPLQKYQRISKRLNHKIQSIRSFSGLEDDSFALMTREEIIHDFFDHIDQPEWLAQLKNNFLKVFANHHPAYEYQNCLPVSGSSRTALSILGFQCGITEVITPDLGWTYEHVFPSVIRIPLTQSLRLDSKAIVEQVNIRMERDPDWNKHAAVMINNPHNASGFVLSEEELSALVRQLLLKRIFIIDDLAYKDISPNTTIKQTPYVKSVCNDLIQKGYLSTDHRQYVITIHSLSKTDTFAGARLGVIEIGERKLSDRFSAYIQAVKSNHLALLLAYLFYRNSSEKVHSFWQLRNRILTERMDAMEIALKNLSAERNPFQIHVRRPEGGMYPHLVVEKLPAGLSLDWLSTQMARQGIGLVSLSAFAGTESGYNSGRKIFRLTLGGSDPAAVINHKMRRLCIDLNRLISNESTKYIRTTSLPVLRSEGKGNYESLFEKRWPSIRDLIVSQAAIHLRHLSKKWLEKPDARYFIDQYLPDRLAIFYSLISERLRISDLMVQQAQSRNQVITEQLEREFYKDDLSDRMSRFQSRLYDRTVHPTQLYGLDVERSMNQIYDAVVYNNKFASALIDRSSEALAKEYLGLNVALDSTQEGAEILCDLQCMIESEQYTRYLSVGGLQPFLSYWGDWDGSTRPSGQGHRLVAAVLMENVTQLSTLLLFLHQHEKDLRVDTELLDQVQKLAAKNRHFWALLNDITQLTNQLEKRLHTYSASHIKSNPLQRMAQKLHLRKDPLTILWEHNDRLEIKMLELRRQRRNTLEFYFELNKRLRKTLYGLISQINKYLQYPEGVLRFGQYHDLLKRFVLTPRIHQKIITSDDQFTIDTTVENISEINEISGRYGNPGMVLALQISMSSQAEALIRLDRKLSARRDTLSKEKSDIPLPAIRLIPLFEDKTVIDDIDSYLEKVWSYSIQSRRIDQEVSERFTEIIGELFFAGSDLSQQVSQAYAAHLYQTAKHSLILWLADRGLIGKIRLKLGSGEPMQRQGGYYPGSSKGSVLVSDNIGNNLQAHISASALQSAKFSQLPLRGILSSGDLRTWQSTISEKLRQISIHDRTEFLFDVEKLQEFDRHEIERITEPLTGTRLHVRDRYIKELDLLTGRQTDTQFIQFLEMHSENFRQILYGREEDVLGIHMISHFISRAIPPLRDRPTVRPGRDAVKTGGHEVVSRISQTLPLSRHGSLLRAIGHNRAQTMILGLNQLTTGLFRTLNMFWKTNKSAGEAQSVISSRILPQLPVFEILHTLRLYQDMSLRYVVQIENAFPAGNSAFVALREDHDLCRFYTGLFQKELLRRCGVEITDFFTGDSIKPEVLPAFKPEIAVLLQPDLFNTDPGVFFSGTNVGPDDNWRKMIASLLQIPLEIKAYRKKIWRLIQKPVFIQVRSFSELAMAIYDLSTGKTDQSLPYVTKISDIIRMGSEVTDILRTTSDDSLRQFLVDVVRMLTQLPATGQEIPLDIMRALRDVKRIARLEEQALSADEQMLLRHHILCMARICGENG